VAATYTDTPLPAAPTRRALRARLVPPFADDRLWGWIGPLMVTVLAGYLRFNRLSIPSVKVFDEVYYAHDALNLLHHGVELNADNTGAGYIVHPPLGKWMIAVGEWIFGNNSLGWRFSSAVVGTLAVLILSRTARRMTRSTLLGCAAGLLMTLDGLEFVQSRTSMLDIFLLFWVVVAFACLICDRDQVRARLVQRASLSDGGKYGPRIGMRWWLLGCGVALGAACASKWDGLYFIPAFGLLALAWTMGAKRAIGVHKPLWSTVSRDLLPSISWMFFVPVIVYIVSWTGWFLNNGKYAWDRNWANGRHTSYGLGFIPAWIRNPARGLWHYHWEMYNFHVHLDSYHTYRSNGWGWLFDTRPVLYYAAYPHPPVLGCTTDNLGCARMIYNLGTPAIWWVSIPVMCYMIYLVFKRDWRGGALIVPLLFFYLPWLHQFKRTMFSFYALPMLPFICIALAVTMGYVIGGHDASPNRRMIGTAIAGAYMLTVVVMFFYFLPIMSAQTVPFVNGWQHRMWFQSWGEDKGS
jgi:dolichyl-phosphate-mannose-protein mannosyltransferase